MTWIDGAILLVLVIMMLKGFVKGLVREACELAGVIFGILYAYKKYQYWGDELIYRFQVPEVIARIAAFSGIVIVLSLCGGLLGLLLSKVIRYTPIGIVDHIAGVGLGFAKGFVVSCLLLVLLAQMPVEAINAVLNRSPLAQQVLGVVPRFYSGLEGLLPPEFPRWQPGNTPQTPVEPPVDTSDPTRSVSPFIYL